ncbi:MAG: NADH-quinone oxidoreductase subunit M [Pseudomonadota bacterium]
MLSTHINQSAQSVSMTALSTSAATDQFLLSLLLIVPFMAFFIIWLIKDTQKIRVVALFSTVLELVISLYILWQFNPQLSGFQFIEQRVWISSLNIQYLVGVDGISILFLPLISLLFTAVILASWNSIKHMVQLYFSMIMLLLCANIGVFIALDGILFFLFWELTLPPIYFLVSLWGIGSHRRSAAIKYTSIMLAGGIPILMSWIYLATQYADIHGGLSFSYLQLTGTPFSLETQSIVFFLFLVGFGVKAPIFPFHSWLPSIAMEGPIAIIVTVTGLKLGAYGMIRFMAPLAPQATQEFHWLLAGLGVIGILYGAIIALGQSNIRRVLAFSSISHVGLIVLGLSTFTIQSIQGMVVQLINFSILSGGLFLLTGFIHNRVGSTDLSNLGGAAKNMPLLASFFFLLGMASLGVPGTNGFVAEHLILFSSIQNHTGAGLAALFGIILSAAYFFRIYRGTFLGSVKNPAIEQSIDLLPRELLIMVVFASFILLVGIFPNSILSLIELSSYQWLSHFK